MPRSLKSEGDALVIEWSDGVTQRLRWSLLRDRCPCATCRTKQDHQHQPQAGQSQLGQSSSGGLLPVIGLEETQPIRPVAVRPVGNYAYNIHFSDGHNTGIYSLEYLRRLGQE